jgi:hypothetical protein
MERPEHSRPSPPAQQLAHGCNRRGQVILRARRKREGRIQQGVASKSEQRLCIDRAKLSNLGRLHRRFLAQPAKETSP